MSQKQSHRERPGEGAANQIAATASKQLARAQAGRPIEPLSEQEARRLAAAISDHPDIFRPVFLDLLRHDLAAAIVAAIRAPRKAKKRAAA